MDVCKVELEGNFARCDHRGLEYFFAWCVSVVLGVGDQDELVATGLDAVVGTIGTGIVGVATVGSVQAREGFDFSGIHVAAGGGVYVEVVVEDAFFYD